jgi:hypothetical protein
MFIPSCLRYWMLDAGCWIKKDIYLSISSIQKPASSIFPIRHHNVLSMILATKFK